MFVLKDSRNVLEDRVTLRFTSASNVGVQNHIGAHRMQFTMRVLIRLVTFQLSNEKALFSGRSENSDALFTLPWDGKLRCISDGIE